MDPAWYEQPVFYFSNPVSLVGHEAPVMRRCGSNELDYELELGLIIGRRGRDISAATHGGMSLGSRSSTISAPATCSVARWRSAWGRPRERISPRRSGHAWSRSTRCAIGSMRSGRLHLQHDGAGQWQGIVARQFGDMYFTWPQIIEHASRDAELLPGDLLGSGTVGTGCILELGPENTGGWLKPGDIVELEIERMGVLRTPIVARNWRNRLFPRSPAREVGRRGSGESDSAREAESCQST